MALAPFLLTALVLFTTVFIGRYFAHKRRSLGFPYPPGPPRDAPWIGHLRVIPKKAPWLTYTEWARQYGPVVSFESFGRRFVVLNSAEAVSDLLEKRGANYSDRDYNELRNIAMSETDVKIMSLMNYTEEFRLHRKIINSAFNPSAARLYFPIQEREATILLSMLLDVPEDWARHLRRASTSIILAVTYGHQVVSDDDYLVELNERAIRHVLPVLTPTNFLVNYIPALKYLPEWLPGTGFKQYARQMGQNGQDTRIIPMKEVKERLASGSAETCYVTTLLDKKGPTAGTEDEEHIIRDTAGVMYAAGGDTTNSGINAFVLAMAANPDAQRKVQAEIDAVVCSDRLPTFADYDSLPYLQYCLHETFRWQPIIKLGLPHAAHNDDTYRGMFIPKDTIIMQNQWAILHDENVYPEPDRFWPERWDGRFPDLPDSRQTVFGAGRRLCPGRHVAMNSIFILAADLMACYTITNAKDEFGEDIELKLDPAAGPEAQVFKCHFIPRSDSAIDLIRTAIVA